MLVKSTPSAISDSQAIKPNIMRMPNSLAKCNNADCMRMFAQSKESLRHHRQDFKEITLPTVTINSRIIRTRCNLPSDKVTAKLQRISTLAEKKHLI